MKFITWSYNDFASESSLDLYGKLLEAFGEISFLEFGVTIAELYREPFETTRLYSLPVESHIEPDMSDNAIIVWLADGEKIFLELEDIPELAMI